MHRRPHQTAALALLALALLAAACSSGSDADASAGSTTVAAEAGALTVLSSRPDMVTGGDLLLKLPAGTAAAEVQVDGKAATTAKGPTAGTVIVRGLAEGPATITAGSATLDVVNHPITGPVFSGPHSRLACNTDGLGLGPATDADCSAPTTVVDKTIGKTEARVEQGVIDRSPYWIVTPKSGWNGRLVYRFGGGCGTSFGQGTLLTNPEDPALLDAGYAVATATFNTFQVQCNDVLSAETVMMVKERFIEQFGPPKFTIGEGASGGAIQQHLIIQNYPGLLDAAAAILPFPDAITTALSVTDCGLLANYFDSAEGTSLDSAQRLAIQGFVSGGTCRFWEKTFLPGINPTDGCDSQIPADEVYSATNPKGLRCTLVDSNKASLGVDPKTGFGRSPLDNVGVQYGRKALLDGTIDVDQFLDLNAAIGGYDIDGEIRPERTVADPTALENAYGKGRVSVGGGGQKKVPLIDLNIYTDDAGDIHDRWRAFSLRARLGSDNQQIWTRSASDGSFGTVVGNITTGGGEGPELVTVLDQWLTTGERPAGAEDNCLGPDGKLIAAEGLYDEPGPCTDRFPIHLDPRQVAGAGIANDILKCQLTPTDPESYDGIAFRPEQATRLAEVFPDGVCDWSKPSVGRVPLEGTWLTYGT